MSEEGRRGRRLTPGERSGQEDVAVAGAVLYCLGTVWGGDPTTVVHAMVALLLSVPLYLFFIRSMEAARQRKRTAG